MVCCKPRAKRSASIGLGLLKVLNTSQVAVQPEVKTFRKQAFENIQQGADRDGNHNVINYEHDKTHVKPDAPEVLP